MFQNPLPNTIFQASRTNVPPEVRKKIYGNLDTRSLKAVATASRASNQDVSRAYPEFSLLRDVRMHSAQVEAAVAAQGGSPLARTMVGEETGAATSQLRDRFGQLPNAAADDPHVAPPRAEIARTLDGLPGPGF